jgi:predicted nucleic acid-binding protein
LTRLAVDASVAVKWFVPEIHSEAALRLLKQKERELLVPDLVWGEVGNILWKKRRRDEITDEDARFVLRQLDRFDWTVHSSQVLAETAWRLSSRLQRTFYDSLYLALAESQSCPLVTADRRLFNAVSPSGFDLIWIEDVV